MASDAMSKHVVLSDTELLKLTRAHGSLGRAMSLEHVTPKQASRMLDRMYSALADDEGSRKPK
jgi:hypothetical protein